MNKIFRYDCLEKIISFFSCPVDNVYIRQNRFFSFYKLLYTMNICCKYMAIFEATVKVSWEQASLYKN